MAYELIITEKPNAAKKIAEALADGKPILEKNGKVSYYKVTRGKKDIVVGCAVGHLYTVAEEEKSFKFPSFDLVWKPTADVEKKSSYSKPYLTTIKKLAKEANEFTVACDYDIEGEVIGLNIVKYACKQHDANRMKFSTLTKPDLVKAYSSKSKTLDWGLAHAGETRHFLDWLYGINLSRALMNAIKKRGTFRVMSIGRVQGPALKLIVDKEVEIQTFQPRKFWQLELHGKVKNKAITAMHQTEKFWDEKEAEKALAKAKGHDGRIDKIEKRTITSPPPVPFDLTSLQTEAYRVFKIKPKDTLSIAQSLYLEGLISYPRTSSQQLPKEIGIPKIFTDLSKNPDYKERIALLKGNTKPNNGKKTDPAHPAIYPTGIQARVKEREYKIYDLVVKRFLATFSVPAERESMAVTIEVNKEPFIAKGILTTKEGWYAVYDPYVKLDETELPESQQGDSVKVKDIKKHDKETQPPRRYTPSSIIKELEKKNLGTKATRAAIIESLYDRNYVINDSLQATDIGLETVKIFDRFLPEIMSDELTRHFEDEMDEIQEKKQTPDTVLDEAKENLTKLLNKFKHSEKEIGAELVKSYKEELERASKVGPCPICKKGTLKVKYSPKYKSRFIGCDQYPDCKTTFNLPHGSKATVTERVCKDCGYPKVIIKGKTRKREVCINPDCKGKAINDPEVKKEVKEVKQGTIEKECPKCGKPLVLRKSIYGEFYGCSGFPKCRHTEKLVDGPLKEDFKGKKKPSKKGKKKKT